MKRVSLWVLAVLATAGSAPLLAQAPPPPAANAEVEQQLAAARDRLDAAAREVADLSSRFGDSMGRGGAPGRLLRMTPRAILGVQIEPRLGVAGAPVVAVSPGGAAEAAGIEAGDVITGIDSTDLAKAAQPARVLVERMRELKPDTKVKLRVTRAGKSREFELLPRVAPPMNRTVDITTAVGGDGDPRVVKRFILRRGPGGGEGDAPEDLHGPMGRQGPPPPPGMGMGMGEPRHLAGLELATLSPRLGGYFGAKAGVLVVRAGNPVFKLEDGDVITAVGGREPTSAAHVTRILRSYQPGEQLTIKVLRDRKPLQLDVVIAAGRGAP